MYYTKQFQEEFEAIVNDKGEHTIEGLLMLISLELLNVANELHEQTELCSASVPKRLTLNEDCVTVHYNK